MEQLLIRDLPTGTKQALKKLAAHKGTSMEAEARAILRSALNAKSRSICEALVQKEPDLSEDFIFDPGRNGVGMREIVL
ncbi:FitA-like ribbon-helix-helix domain-containing protein [Arcanobacterium haemolyticum]